MTRPATFFIIFLTASVLIVCTHSRFLPKREEVNYLAKEAVIDPQKRPFCNAFTGCGRKRSNLPPLIDQQRPQQHHILDESIASLLELNSEPGLEDLSRQILSEAKLWEAIQEANLELRRAQETDDSLDNFAPPPPSQTRNSVNSCAVPPCYI